MVGVMIRFPKHQTRTHARSHARTDARSRVRTHHARTHARTCSNAPPPNTERNICPQELCDARTWSSAAMLAAQGRWRHGIIRRAAAGKLTFVLLISSTLKRVGRFAKHGLPNVVLDVAQDTDNLNLALGVLLSEEAELAHSEPHTVAVFRELLLEFLRGVDLVLLVLHHLRKQEAERRQTHLLTSTHAHIHIRTLSSAGAPLSLWLFMHRAAQNVRKPAPQTCPLATGVPPEALGRGSLHPPPPTCHPMSATLAEHEEILRELNFCSMFIDLNIEAAFRHDCSRSTTAGAVPVILRRCLHAPHTFTRASRPLTLGVWRTAAACRRRAAIRVMTRKTTRLHLPADADDERKTSRLTGHLLEEESRVGFLGSTLFSHRTATVKEAAAGVIAWRDFRRAPGKRRRVEGPVTCLVGGGLHMSVLICQQHNCNADEAEPGQQGHA